MISSCGIILLAAGSSSRLGKPKQLLVYKDKNLLQYLIEVVKKSSANPLIVVLGANSDRIQPVLQTGNIKVAINNEWKEGMASSIRCGLTTLLEVAPLTESVILMVCDQPYVTSKLLNDLLMMQQETGRPIVTSQYENIPGPPALFHKIIFPELLTLRGDTGARKIVERHSHETATVPFPKGNIDIDTEADYNVLVKTDFII